MSDQKAILHRIRSAVESLDFQGMRDALNEARASNIPGYSIVNEGILEGAKRSGEIGLMVAAEALRKELVDIAAAERERQDVENPRFSGRVIIGTIRGDIHDFGKNILTALLGSVGIDVEDLGVDVPASDFLKRARSPEVKVIALSSLLSTGVEGIKKTIQTLQDSGLRNKVKVIIGGAAATNEVAEKVKADAYAEDAVKGLEIIEKWMSNSGKR